MLYNYKGEILQFKLQNEIGRGGNGTVYKILCKPLSDEELVVKILNPSNNRNKPYPLKKYNRFKIEVEQGKKLSHLSNCFLQIVDCYLPETPKEDNRPWFVMPFARPLKDSIFKLKVEGKIRVILEIGNAIKILHDNGYAHRDIKLDNLLIYKNKVVLCDFGLIRHHSIKRLTDVKEPIGPWNTIAPEMKRVASRFIVPREADIYSFGKLIWIILTEDEHCFDGKYSRHDIMSLNSNEKIKVGGLRIIHEVLERATENLSSKRPGIDEVLEKIGLWRKVLNDEKLIREERILELYENMPNLYNPTEYIYREPNQIYEILSKLLNEHNLYKDSIGTIGPIIEIKRAKIENYLSIDTKKKSYIFNPLLLKYTDNKWFLSTTQIDEKRLEREGVVLDKDNDDILKSLFDQALFKNKKDKSYKVIDAENDIILRYKVF